MAPRATPQGEAALLLEAARQGSHRALGRLVSLAEDGGGAARPLAGLLATRAGGSARPVHVVGLTGSPGVGKSTATAALLDTYRAAGRRVAVLAVDPSSPFTGGALLGDRVRMQRHALDDGVYIRSMASRGHLGGLSATTPDVIGVLEACGFDVILLETVGVGQAEVEVARYADTVAVLVAAGLGDSVQIAKAGILEIADVLVVNKADREGAVAVANELRQMLDLARRPEGDFSPRVLLVSAGEGGGIADFVEELDRHRAFLEASGELSRRRVLAARTRIATIALGLLERRLTAVDGAEGLASLTERVLAGELDPYAAAELLAEAAAGRRVDR